MHQQVIAHDFLEGILKAQILLSPKPYRMAPGLKLVYKLFLLFIPCYN